MGLRRLQQSCSPARTSSWRSARRSSSLKHLRRPAASAGCSCAAWARTGRQRVQGLPDNLVVAVHACRHEQLLHAGAGVSRHTAKTSLQSQAFCACHRGIHAALAIAQVWMPQASLGLAFSNDSCNQASMAPSAIAAGTSQATDARTPSRRGRGTHLEKLWRLGQSKEATRRVPAHQQGSRRSQAALRRQNGLGWGSKQAGRQAIGERS